MKSKTVWIAVVLLIVVLLLIVPVISGLTGFGWHWDMMGGRGMMRGGYGYFSPLGYIWMGLMALVPVALVVLLVLAGVSLVNSLTSSGRSVPPPAVISGRTCPNCSKPAQADWNNCPYCGTPLSS
jgi:hypothetical protein